MKLLRIGTKFDADKNALMPRVVKLIFGLNVFLLRCKRVMVRENIGQAGDEAVSRIKLVDLKDIKIVHPSHAEIRGAIRDVDSMKSGNRFGVVQHKAPLDDTNIVCRGRDSFIKNPLDFGFERSFNFGLWIHDGFHRFGAPAFASDQQTNRYA